MNCTSFGSPEKETIILLHGGGLSWWNYRDAAQLLAADYHVILPVLDGHAQSDADFTTIEANAAAIIAYIDNQLGGSVLLIAGLSLGGQILIEILSQRRNICRYALIESALVIPSKCIHAMIRPAFGSCFGLIRHRWFSRLQFRSLRIREALFEDYYRDTCRISKANMIAFLEANALYTLKPTFSECNARTHVFVGQKENYLMRKSARIIHQALPGSTLHILPRMHHGEFSINHATDYAQSIREMITRG